MKKYQKLLCSLILFFILCMISSANVKATVSTNGTGKSTDDYLRITGLNYSTSGSAAKSTFTIPYNGSSYKTVYIKLLIPCNNATATISTSSSSVKPTWFYDSNDDPFYEEDGRPSGNTTTWNGSTLGTLNVEDTISPEMGIQVKGHRYIYIKFYNSDATNITCTVTLHQHGYVGSRTSYYNDTYCKIETLCSCKYVTTTKYSAHDYDEGTTVEATCTTDKTLTQTCSNCKHQKVTTYPGTAGHNLIMAGSYTSDSHTLKCSRCSYTTTQAHTLNNGVCACGYVQSSGGSGGSGDSSGSGGSGSSGNNGNSGSSIGNVVSVVPGNIAATKLDAKRANITVTCPNGCAYTNVYCNNKLIKTLYASSNFVWKAKGATKAKYKTCSVFLVNGTATTSAFSAEVKPAKNVISFPGAGSYNAGLVGTFGSCTLKTAKLSFSGKKLKCVAYIYNNSSTKVKQVKIHQSLVVNGKVYNKTIKKTVNIKPFGKKKITYYLGSGISDIRNGITDDNSYIEAK